MVNVKPEARGPFVLKNSPDLSVAYADSVASLGGTAPNRPYQARLTKCYIQLREIKDIAVAWLCLRLEVLGVSKALSEVSLYRFKP